MKNLYSIGQAAKLTYSTVDTLRHYDKIDLLKPSKVDNYSNYRYYDNNDIIRIKTIKAFQKMGLSLSKIKEVLSYNNLEQIIDFLNSTKKQVNEQIKSLEDTKKYIELAKENYLNKKIESNITTDIYVKYFPKRAIILSDEINRPSLDVLWNYLDNFSKLLDPSIKEKFTFKDVAGVYTSNNISKMFATCITYSDISELIILPEGNYLCTDCSDFNKDEKIKKLTLVAKQKYNSKIDFTIEEIILSGILQWNYQIQIFIGE